MLAVAPTAWASSAVSEDVILSDGRTAVVAAGSLRIDLRRSGSSIRWRVGARTGTVARWTAAHDPGRIRVEIAGDDAGSAVALERTRFATKGATLSITPAAARANRLATTDAPPSLLAHRAAALDSRTPANRCLAPSTSTAMNVTRARWDCGALAGWLWEAQRQTNAPRWLRDRAVARGSSSLALAALQPTLIGTHDSGSLVIDATLPAIELCRAGTLRKPGLCAEMLGQARGAVETLVELASMNPVGAVIRRSPRNGGSQAIVDSLMNIPLLWWASRTDGSPRAAAIAERHALWVAANLVDADGASHQAANFDMAGSIVSKATLQGKAPSGVWSRGQAWAINGLAEAAGHTTGDASRTLRDRAELAADWMLDHLPADGIPRWDMTAPESDPVDLSTSAIAARGLALLADLCAVGDCSRSAASWHSAGCDLLATVFANTSRVPPLGATFKQVDWKGHGAWGNDAELPFTAMYALRADRLLGDCHSP